MTIEEAQTYAGWIQQAFPHMKMTPKLYTRMLVHYDSALASKAILDAITDEWKHLPKVSEVSEVLQRAKKSSPTVVSCETCDGHRLVVVGGGYAPCPDCHPMSGEDYLRSGESVYYMTQRDERPLDPAKVRELMSR